MTVSGFVVICCLASSASGHLIPHKPGIVHTVHARSASYDVTSNSSNDVANDKDNPYDPGTYGNHTKGDGNETNESSHESHGIHVASWNYKYVEQPFIIALFLLTAGIFKLGFHHADFLSSIVPESCLLVILGVLVGLILHLSEEDTVFPVYMTPRLFFLFLLPPIILESAYSLHDRVFFDNVGTVLLYAVVGTILNCFIIGPLLYLLADVGAMGEIRITLVQCLVFSSLVVAVDPVAVLAIFQEVGVNNVLYFLVFGESLLNDAVTVVLYNTMKEFNVMEEIPAHQLVLAVAAFFTVSLGGLFVGLLFGVFTAVITKYTVNVRVVEPLALFVLAYMSYLVAEMFHFSGIISIIGCGLTQANYAFHNVSQKTNSTVKYFSKMLSSTSDCIIFLFLGMTLFRSSLVWHTGFILWTLVLCLAVRFLVVFCLTFIANKVNRLKKIDLEEQFIMAYGGLRGAVCFSLVDMLDPETIAHKDLFVTTTLVVVFFTVFVQGISIKPLVKCLRIRLKEQQLFSIYDEINMHVTDHVMAGIEEVLGRKGQYFWREILDYYDDKYLRNYLQRTPSKTDERIMDMYEKMLLRQHFENLSSSKFPEQYASSMYLFNGGDDRSESSEELDEIREFGKSFDVETPSEEEMEKFARAREEGRRRSRGYSIIPAIVAADKRRESRGIIRQNTIDEVPWEYDVGKRRPSKIIANPTAKDIRKMLAKNPSQLLHQERADKNLKGEDNADIVQLLQRKRAQTRRMSQNIGGNYDGIFQGALLSSHMRELSPWRTSKNPSFEQQSPSTRRGRAHSSFTPEEAARLGHAAKKRSQFSRAATVGDQQAVTDLDTDDRSPLLQQRTKPKAGSSSSMKTDSNKSLRWSGERIDKEPAEIKIPELKTRRDRAKKWRKERSKRAQTFDVAEPLLEETLPDVTEGDSDIPLSVIREESQTSNGLSKPSSTDPEGGNGGSSARKQNDEEPRVLAERVSQIKPKSGSPAVGIKSDPSKDLKSPGQDSSEHLHLSSIPRNPSYVKAVCFDHSDTSNDP